MSLGARQLTLAAAALVCVTVLGGCADDEPSAPDPTAATSAATPTESTEPPVETPTSTTATPTVEPATGPKLTHDLAEITMPEGWAEKDNFGVPFVLQGGDDLFGILTFSELGGSQAPARSLDALAKRQLRIAENPALKRLDDVVLGDGTNAYRLAGRDGKLHYQEYYGAMIGNYEYVMQFDFTTQYGTIEEGQELIESMLVTWDFNP